MIRQWKHSSDQARGLTLNRLSGQNFDGAGAVLRGATGGIAAHLAESLAHNDMQAEWRHISLSDALVTQFVARVVEGDDFEARGGDVATGLLGCRQEARRR